MNPEPRTIEDLHGGHLEVFLRLTRCQKTRFDRATLSATYGVRESELAILEEAGLVERTFIRGKTGGSEKAYTVGEEGLLFLPEMVRTFRERVAERLNAGRSEDAREP